MNPQDEITTPASPPSSFAAPAAPAVAPPPAWAGALEQFARDYMKDRRSERRWRVFFRLSWLLLIALVVWASFAARNTTSAPSGPHTALVEVRGEISPDGEASAENVVAALRAAFEDEGAQAVVLRFNSPGGSPVQAGLINDEIQRLKALHKKKVYAVIEEACASGAYYIAVAADEIYTDKASIVGSIGVLMDGFGFTGTMEKLGVERRMLTAGENKGIGDPFSPMTEKQRAYTQVMLDQIHQQFIDVVKQGRGPRLKVGPDTFSGLYWNGEQAIAMGLADHLGSLDYVAREVVQAAEIIDYTPKENVAERLAKRFGASVGAGAVKALRSVGSIH
ncbi:S49 family peptidase [Piscinibacter gummiphilus]|uniref:Peptidase S49 n=1 Tax=Piscinibacter gummiphilus TaxID=946333 RepID=A0A1W6LEF1_9BURK|nr:S49 family peptidase [Piscinibacter gummiphilus]ARN22597.1 peptidase S49 [Piscinibacter gummiphilus]ATU67296.1 S49 family peptidase [Piscinibacter gummiphilus]GLS97635.1 peptidase [Piscinibacter gummiphilus]